MIWDKTSSNECEFCKRLNFYLLREVFFVSKLISCLPFFLFAFSLSAQQTIGLFQNDPAAFNGYTLFSNSKITYLIDNCGRIINIWESDFDPGASVYLLENGDLLRTARIAGAFSGGGTGGRIERFGWEGELEWSYSFANDTMHQHHDIEPLPNGNFLMICWEAKTESDALKFGRKPNTITPLGLWSEQILEIEMVGSDTFKIVWEWHLWDHLIQEFDAQMDNFGMIEDHPELLDINAGALGGGGPGTGPDWIHLNAVNYNPDLDQIALSSRHLNEIWIIDHSTNSIEAATHSGGNAGKGGDFLYRYGNPENYGRGNNSDQQFFGQHDVRWIPKGFPSEGSLLVFNNGQNRPDGNYSSVDIWEPPIDELGNYFIDSVNAFGPSEFLWSYQSEGFYSQNLSGAHLLENGNVLICHGRSGRFFEVTWGQELVWDYINPVSSGHPLSQGQTPNANSTFRATRYSIDYAAFGSKVLTPGAPIELNPIPSDCVIFDSDKESPSFNLQEKIKFLNNPISNTLLIENQFEGKIEVQIWDLMGFTVFSGIFEDGLINIESKAWGKGLYVVQIKDVSRKAIFNTKIVKN